MKKDGFLEAETGLLADDLDDLDLLGADFLQDDVELGLLFHGLSSGSGGTGGHDGTGGGRHAKLLLQSLDQLGQLQNGHCLQISNQLFLIHDNSP